MRLRSGLRSTSIETAGAILVLCALQPAALVRESVAASESRGHLDEELKVARSHELYLLLRAGSLDLDLKVDGVVLRRFALKQAEFGQPRYLGAAQAIWPATTFTLVSELPEPDRPSLGAQKAGIGAQEAPAARLDVPATYRLKFSPGLVMVVRGEAKPMDVLSRLRRLGFRLQEGFEALAAWLRGHPVAHRVVLHLAADDARRLFKALTPEIRLVVAVPEEAEPPVRIASRSSSARAAAPRARPSENAASLAGAGAAAAARPSPADSAVAQSADSVAALLADSLALPLADSLALPPADSLASPLADSLAREAKSSVAAEAADSAGARGTDSAGARGADSAGARGADSLAVPPINRSPALPLPDTAAPQGVRVP